MPVKQGSGIRKSGRVFGQGQKTAKMVRAGLYARVSTQDQQTLPMQNRAMREYAARRGWTIAMQVKEVGSGAALAATPGETAGSGTAQGDRRCCGVATGPLGKIGNRPAGHTAGTGASRRRLRIAHRGAGSDHPGGSCNGRAAGRFRRLRARDPGGTRAGRSRSCPPERQTAGPTR